MDSTTELTHKTGIATIAAQLDISTKKRGNSLETTVRTNGKVSEKHLIVFDQPKDGFFKIKLFDDQGKEIDQQKLNFTKTGNGTVKTNLTGGTDLQINFASISALEITGDEGDNKVEIQGPNFQQLLINLGAGKDEVSIESKKKPNFPISYIGKGEIRNARLKIDGEVIKKNVFSIEK